MRYMENDVVKLLAPIPDTGLGVGAVGTVVAVYNESGNEMYEVEFSDADGSAIAMLALPSCALELQWKYPWPERSI